MRNIIVDSGATKADWTITEGSGILASIKTDGVNFAVMKPERIAEIFAEAAAGIKAAGMCGAGNLYFYAAGAVTADGAAPESARQADAAFREALPEVRTWYYSDMVAAARAVCGHSSGIAAIMGTGANCCLFDGENVGRGVHPGGFILGDEGSGAALGKIFISDCIKDLVPQELIDYVGRDFDLSYPSIVANVYRGDAPSKYLGSFAPYIAGKADEIPYAREITERNFRDFIRRCLIPLGAKSLPVGVIGGFGFAWQEIIRRVGAEEGVTFSRFLKSPMQGLIEWHSASSK